MGKRHTQPHRAVRARRALAVAGTLIACISVLWSAHTAYAVYVATTTVSLTVCGDGIVSGLEVCDDGTNTGAYSTTIVGRHCTPTCNAWGPYCGDASIQSYYGEQCDDGNNTAGDLCDPLCQNETTPVVEGGGGGGSSSGGGGGKSGSGNGQQGIAGASTEGNVPFVGNTNVTIQGRAYPGATVTVLRDGTVERVIEAGSDAAFSFTLADQTAGITTFGFWALDHAGRTSITYSATFQIVENAVTTLSGILLPPTLAVVPEKAPPGSMVSFEGSAVPSTNVEAYVDQGQTPEQTVAATNGDWTIAYDTTPLSVEQFHMVKAHYIDPQNAALKSGYSKITSFYVGNNAATSTLTANLNHDSSVNLTDFSILLFNWGATGGIADLNADGAVSLPDFSIMLFYWTG